MKRPSALVFFVAAAMAALLVSCATTPQASAVRFHAVTTPIGKPDTLSVTNLEILYGSYNFQTGPTMIRLTLTDTLSTPIKVEWGLSQIQSGSERSTLYLPSQKNLGETPHSVILLAGQALTARFLPSNNVRFSPTSDLSFLGASPYSYIPMTSPDITVYLSYNDSRGFAGPSKAVTVVFTPLPTANKAS